MMLMVVGRSGGGGRGQVKVEVWKCDRGEGGGGVKIHAHIILKMSHSDYFSAFLQGMTQTPKVLPQILATTIKLEKFLSLLL